MGMSVGSSGGEGAPMMEMNTTPLIDVMLVLIIMLTLRPSGLLGERVADRA